MKKNIVILQLYTEQEEKEMENEKTKKTMMIRSSKEAVQLIN